MTASAVIPRPSSTVSSSVAWAHVLSTNSIRAASRRNGVLGSLRRSTRRRSGIKSARRAQVLTYTFSIGVSVKG